MAAVKPVKGGKVRLQPPRKLRPDAAPMYRYTVGEDGRHHCLRCGSVRGEQHEPGCGG